MTTRKRWSPEEIEARLELTLRDYQREAIRVIQTMDDNAERMLLYFKTGAGKTYTALASLVSKGYEEALVVAPPSTHASWQKAAESLNVDVTTISHAKFRMKTYKPSRNIPVIADEMHEFGGAKAQGWTKLFALTRGLKAPLILASATPNYNDVERLYCIEALLTPEIVKGGPLQWIYRHCETEQNPFGATPKVVRLWHFEDVQSYMAQLPGTVYVPDDAVYTIGEFVISLPVEDCFDRFSYDSRRKKIMSSRIEQEHQRTFHRFTTEDGFIRESVLDVLADLVGMASTPSLIYAQHAVIADALARTFDRDQVSYGLVTGKTTKKRKLEIIEEFIAGKYDVLIGTDSLATGTDGMDKMCDSLIILDDTNDDSKRRQLLGRILSRGAVIDDSKKIITRILPV